MISRAQSCATVKTMTGVSVRLRLVNITQLWGFRKVSVMTLSVFRLVSKSPKFVAPFSYKSMEIE